MRWYRCCLAVCVGALPVVSVAVPEDAERGYVESPVESSIESSVESPAPQVQPNSVQVVRKDGVVQSVTLNVEDYLEIMRQQHKLPEAERVLLQLLDAAEHPDIKAQMAYYLGMIAFELADYVQAEKYYRQALAYAPGYMWSQLELAATLFILEKYEASRYYFEQVRKNTANAEILQTVHAYLQSIASRRKIDYTFDVGLYPNNNVNNVPQVESYQFFGRTVTPTERPKSAIGITYDMSVYYKKRGRGDDIFTLTLAPSGTKYRDGQYDSTLFSISLHRLRQLQRGYTTQKIHIGRSFYGGHKDRKIWGLALARGWYVGQKTLVSLSGDWGHTNLMDNNYDVFKTALIPSVQYYINDVSSIQVHANHTRTNHDLPHLSGTQKGIGVGYKRTLKNGVVLSPSASVNRFVSDIEQTGLGGIRIRQTTAVNLAVQLAPYTVFNFVPTVKLGANRIDSTIEMDRAKNTTFNLIFKRTF